MTASGGIPDLDEAKKLKKTAPLYTYPGYPPDVNPESLPKIVTEHAKYIFEIASEKGSLGADGHPTRMGQGLIGVSWLGKNDKNENVIYLDVLPAFNKNDGRLQVDKNGNEYKKNEFVYTDEPLGGNSGRNHVQFFDIIQNRVQIAFDTGDQKTLKMYEGSYSVLPGKKIKLNKKVMHGFSLFKGDQDVLLSQFRNVSANLNFESVSWNSEYLLINYFYKNLNESLPQAFYLKRPIPQILSDSFKEAFINQLNCDPKTQRACLVDGPVNYSEKKAISVMSDPQKIINRLVETMAKAIISEISTAGKVFKEAFEALKKNIELMVPGEVNQKEFMAQCLNAKTVYNKQSVYATALIKKNNQTMIKLLQTNGAKFPDITNTETADFLLKGALINNNVDFLIQLLKKGAVPDKLIYLEAVKLNDDEFFDILFNDKKSQVSTQLKKEMLQLAVNLIDYHTVLVSVKQPKLSDMKPGTFVLVSNDPEVIDLYRLDENKAMFKATVPSSAFDELRGYLPRVGKTTSEAKLIDLIGKKFNCSYATKGHDRSIIYEQILNKNESEFDELFLKSQLNIALQNNNVEIALILAKNLAKREDTTMLVYAAQEGHWPIIKEILRKENIINKPCNDYGQSLLYLAALHGQLELVKNLLDKKADINLKTQKHEYPAIFAAIAKDDSSLVKLFIDRGVDLAAQDQSGRTALLAAVKLKKNDIVKVLVDCPRVTIEDCKQAIQFTADIGILEILNQAIIAKNQTQEELKEPLEKAPSLSIFGSSQDQDFIKSKPLDLKEFTQELAEILVLDQELLQRAQLVKLAEKVINTDEKMRLSNISSGHKLGAMLRVLEQNNVNISSIRKGESVNAFIESLIEACKKQPGARPF